MTRYANKLRVARSSLHLHSSQSIAQAMAQMAKEEEEKKEGEDKEGSIDEEENQNEKILEETLDVGS